MAKGQASKDIITMKILAEFKDSFMHNKKFIFQWLRMGRKFKLL